MEVSPEGARQPKFLAFTVAILAILVAATTILVNVRSIADWIAKPAAGSSANTAAGCKDRRAPAEYLKGTVRVGINGRLRGWSKGQLEPDGTVRDPQGFDVDLVKFIAATHDFDVIYVAVRPLERAYKLKTCAVDLIVANYSWSPDRDSGYKDRRGRTIPAVDFAGPYFRDVSGVACVNKMNFDCETDPIPQERTCVVEGTKAEDSVPRATVAQFNTECLQKLYNEHDDVVSYVTDKTILEAYEESVGQVGTAIQANRPGEPVSQELYGIGLPDDSRELCATISADIDRFIDIEAWAHAFRNNLQGQDPAGRNPGRTRPSDWCR